MSSTEADYAIGTARKYAVTVAMWGSAWISQRLRGWTHAPTSGIFPFLCNWPITCKASPRIPCRWISCDEPAVKIEVVNGKCVDECRLLGGLESHDKQTEFYLKVVASETVPIYTPPPNPTVFSPVVAYAAGMALLASTPSSVNPNPSRTIEELLKLRYVASGTHPRWVAFTPRDEPHHLWVVSAGAKCPYDWDTLVIAPPRVDRRLRGVRATRRTVDDAVLFLNAVSETLAALAADPAVGGADRTALTLAGFSLGSTLIGLAVPLAACAALHPPPGAAPRHAHVLTALLRGHGVYRLSPHAVAARRDIPALEALIPPAVRAVIHNVVAGRDLFAVPTVRRGDYGAYYHIPNPAAMPRHLPGGVDTLPTAQKGAIGDRVGCHNLLAILHHLRCGARQMSGGGYGRIMGQSAPAVELRKHGVADPEGSTAADGAHVGTRPSMAHGGGVGAPVDRGIDVCVPQGVSVSMSPWGTCTVAGTSWYAAGTCGAAGLGRPAVCGPGVPAALITAPVGGAFGAAQLPAAVPPARLPRGAKGSTVGAPAPRAGGDDGVWGAAAADEPPPPPAAAPSPRLRCPSHPWLAPHAAFGGSGPQTASGGGTMLPAYVPQPPCAAHAGYGYGPQPAYPSFATSGGWTPALPSSFAGSPLPCATPRSSLTPPPSPPTTASPTTTTASTSALRCAVSC